MAKLDELIVKEAEKLLRRLERVQKFGSKYSTIPKNEISSLIQEIKELGLSIPAVSHPATFNDLLQAELKKRLLGESAYLDQRLSNQRYDFEKVISLFGIPREDLDSLKPWLRKNKEKTQDSIERLFNSTEVEDYHLQLNLDIPTVAKQAESIAAVEISRYHKIIGKFLESLTNVGSFLRDIDTFPTSQERSYFNPLTTTLAISIPSICFSRENRILEINHRELIRLYGHEGMGHGLRAVLTKTNSLPYFLTQPSALTTSTEESLAQFYQTRLFEDLNESPETQKKLGIKHIFPEIYQEAKNLEQYKEYSKRLQFYAICVLADKSLGKPSEPKAIKRKIDAISEFALYGDSPMIFIEENRHKFDSQGNLSPGLVRELIYCARPVERAIDEFRKLGIFYDKNGRNLIDMTFLKGYWTPTGFVDYARIKAKEFRNSSE